MIRRLSLVIALAVSFVAATAGAARSDTLVVTDERMSTLNCFKASRTQTGTSLDCELVNDTGNTFLVDVSSTGSLVYSVEVRHDGHWQIVDVADPSAKAERYTFRPAVAIAFAAAVVNANEPVRVSANVYRSLESAPVVVSSRDIALPGSAAGKNATPFLLGSDMVAPRVVYQPAPVYPDMARLARLQGTVELSCVIDTSGRVTEVTVVKGIPILAEAAVNALKQRRYRPARDAEGHPVPVYFEVTTSFKYR